MSDSLIVKTLLVSIAAVFLYTIAAGADVVTDGLISYYSFDSGTIDGNTVEDGWGDNDGEILAGVDVVAGKIGSALEFDGTAGKVLIDGDDNLNFNGAEEFSVGAWVYRNGPSGGTCCGPIIGQRDLAGWVLRDDVRDVGSEIEFIIQPGWTGDGADFGVELPEGEWHHIMGVCGDGMIRLYYDGEMVNEIAFAGPVLTNGGAATELGGASDGYFNGIIDEALIYNRALTDAEVMQNFQSTRFFAVNSDGKLTVLWGSIKTSR